MKLAYRYRIKDAGASRRRALRGQARAVNFIWNFCCRTDRKAASNWAAGRNCRRPSAFDLQKLCTGISAEIGIHSDTMAAVCAQFERSRKRCFPKTPRFRSQKRNLDWIPFNHAWSCRLDGARLTVRKKAYSLWLSRPIPEGAKRGSWSLSTDARGRWYANFIVQVSDGEARNGSAVGIDLGLKDFAVLSTGEKIDMPAFYRRSEAERSLYQQRGQKRSARAIAAKVANQRRDYLHRVSTKIVRRNARIYVGDVNAARLAQTRMGKSVNDAGWSMFRNMLRYKSIATGAVCEVVSERWTTRTCSDCGSIGGPEGIAGCGIRAWECAGCGAVHDRDVNAAKNILRLGAKCRPLAEGISTLTEKALIGSYRTQPRVKRLEEL